MRKLNPIMMLNLIVWLTAAAVPELTGCGERKESQTAAEIPQKVARAERSEGLRSLIAAELAAGNKSFVILPGLYRIPSEQGFHLQFKNLSDVEIIAENVEMVCTSTVQAVLFDHCSNVTLRKLVVDYDPLPFTQGKIIAAAPAQQARRGALETQLIEELRQQGDPRMSGGGEVFDRYPYAGKERGLYDRYLKGGKLDTSWVNPTDAQPSPIQQKTNR